MKNYLLVAFLYFWTLASFAQSFPNFTGSYISQHTSYVNNEDASENYQEDTENRVFVLLKEDGTGFAALVDPRTPDVSLLYSIERLDKEYTLMDVHYYIFDAVYLTRDWDVKILFYIKEEKLNLMLDYDFATQVFHDLEYWDNLDYWKEILFKE
ncbi:MAG TPA: hypothetical protein VFF21_04280 [Flavobacteriaceae bacterium]|nr:hypothetical protein [Flavobacteriaceae bacterium]